MGLTAALVHLNSDFEWFLVLFYAEYNLTTACTKPLIVNSVASQFRPLWIRFAYSVYDLQKFNSPQNTSNTFHVPATDPSRYHSKRLPERD